MRAKGLARRFNNAEDPSQEQILAGDAMGPARRALAAELFGLSTADIERLQPVIEPPIQVDCPFSAVARRPDRTQTGSTPRSASRSTQTTICACSTALA